jgi:F0F1-type ATP synthase delta subunit
VSENKNEEKTAGLELTPNIITTLDLARVIREAEKLDDFLHQASLRPAGSSAALPKTTHALENIAEANGLSLLDATHRKHLIGNLHNLKSRTKKVHISFAVEPSPAVVQKIVSWMRKNIEKDIVVEIGLQPTISVGCIIRTTNKVFDLSLKNRFSSSKDILAGLLEKSE